MDSSKLMTQQPLGLAWPAIILFFFVVVILLPPELGLNSVAYGDHASNSMLVLEAKNLTLMHGNYSRVGFYHPGPYFFWVMAAGEFLFHDLLPISASPEGAHRLAIGISNLVLVSLAFRLLSFVGWGHGDRVVVMLLGVAIIVDQAPALSSLWPPNMYVVPAFLFTMTIWTIVRGDGRGLPYFLLASSILVHGHASNIGLVPIMAVGTAVAFLIGRKLGGEPANPKSLWEWVRPHAAATIAVFLVFVMPIAANTLLNWPGEIPKYFSHSSGAGNAFFPSLAYLGQYWQAWPWFIIVFSTFAALVRLRSRIAISSGAVVAFTSEVYAAIATMVITFGAMAFYAIKGIDDLQFPYIGLWYLGAVAGLITTTSGSLLAILKEPKFASRILSISLVALAYVNLSVFNTQPHIFRNTLMDSPLNNDGAAADAFLFQLDRHAPNAEMFRLSLDRRQDWEILWPATAGLMNRGLRTGATDLCIESEDWHLLFHAHGKCAEYSPASEPAYSQRYVASTIELPDGKYRIVADMQQFHTFNAYTIYAPRPLDEAAVDLSDATDAPRVRMLLGEGWSEPTGPLVWQTHDTATLRLDDLLGQDGDQTLVLGLISNLPAGRAGRTVRFMLDGLKVAEVVLDADITEHNVSVTLPGEALRTSSLLTIATSEMFSEAEWRGEAASGHEIGVGLRFVGQEPHGRSTSNWRN